MYGSKHERYEKQAVYEILKYYQDKAYIHNFDLYNIFTKFKSNLLLSGGKIPEGDYKNIIMKQTIVPGRNLILSSIMAGIAESIDAEAIGLGVHSGDHFIYPDCRPEFIIKFSESVKLSSENKVSVTVPFLNFTKSDILKLGFSLKAPVPYHLTRTCYKNQPVACGKCGSCQERLEAFKNIKIKDPIEYE
jgi:7-cyano-7-deazaguanine synthase